MDKDQTLRLLIVEESRNDAEALANILRNSGQASRLDYAEDSEDLIAALDKHVPDLVLCALGLESISLADVAELMMQREITAPLIAIGEEANEANIIEAMRQGASDLCSYDQPDHLQLVTQREIRHLSSSSQAQNFEARFQESEKRARLLMESSRDAIAYVHEGMHIFANSSYLEMFGFDDIDEIEGTPILDMVAPDDHDKFKEFLRNFSKEESSEGSLETHGQLPDGKQFDAMMEFSPASIDSEACTQIIIRNQVGSSKELEQKIKFLSKQDILTGLYNRQYFMEELELSITNAVSGSENAALIYMLMDNFKDIKDNMGIGAADMVISDIADLLRKHADDNDIVARFGDHSFTILRKDCDHDSITALGDEIRQVIEEHIAEIEGKSVTTTCSIGMSIISESAPSAHEVISRADLACEVARSSGGNKIHLHNPVVDEKIGKERDQQMHTLIKNSLENNQFRLLYQPIVSLQGDTSEKYEVLLRMLNEEEEDILPSQFLPIAEQTGQTAEIDHWVIDNAIRTLAEHRSHGSDTEFFIKISAQTLLDESLVAFINDCLKEHRLPGDALVFELSEKVASQHLKQAKAFVKTLKDLRCKSVLEHFGTSPNSFQLLKHMPVDFLKIDGSFIHNLASDTDNQAVVKSILETANSMNKQCIAEYVQDAHSLAVLWQSGINFIQGNFLQEPSENLSYDFTGEVA
ncbi:FOG: PAS/PAC domain [hydrothermal vent metagenome]|uniref:FOG: PAS/PAC domain n=1 Tax=hydrothermal vent metagenome TaxID=652676 RepID=A0A3B0YA14_9ZZZZ